MLRTAPAASTARSARLPGRKLLVKYADTSSITILEPKPKIGTLGNTCSVTVSCLITPCHATHSCRTKKCHLTCACLQRANDWRQPHDLCSAERGNRVVFYIAPTTSEVHPDRQTEEFSVIQCVFLACWGLAESVQSVSLLSAVWCLSRQDQLLTDLMHDPVQSPASGRRERAWRSWCRERMSWYDTYGPLVVDTWIRPQLYHGCCVSRPAGQYRSHLHTLCPFVQWCAVCDLFFVKHCLSCPWS